MVRDLLKGALDEFIQEHMQLDREQDLDRYQEDGLVEDLNKYVVHYFAAGLVLRNMGGRMSERHKVLVNEGQSLAFDYAIGRAKSLILYTRYDVEQLVARSDSYTHEANVPILLYLPLVEEAVELGR